MARDLELLTVGRISIDLWRPVGADWHGARSFTRAVGGSPRDFGEVVERLEGSPV
ncbi:MAG: hypothetical protein JO262_08480 [Solirubrobacterales bacterium]|nr:hypothetical protein [Solirubrobacterales bacterium]MBV9942146.1 hypothetical protein [Solirubrobacterales bacterium]